MSKKKVITFIAVLLTIIFGILFGINRVLKFFSSIKFFDDDENRKN